MTAGIFKVAMLSCFGYTLSLAGYKSRQNFDPDGCFVMYFPFLRQGLNMDATELDSDTPTRTLRALVLDPDNERGKELQNHLRFLEYDAEIVDAVGAERRLIDEKESVDVLLIGPCSSDNGLLDLFRRLRQLDNHLAVIHMLEDGAVVDGQTELDAGCVASINLPVRFSDIQGALQQAGTYRENRKLTGRPRSLELFRNLVGGSPAIRAVRKLIEQVARTDASVLLLGESGTGKEVVARHVHYQSGSSLQAVRAGELRRHTGRTTRK